ncbi:PTS transporter subunit EIIC [Candidatus Mycoplasma pogonae]
MKNILSVLKTKTQSLGSTLSSMIMPIIGIFIAWGILTSFFIPTGWAPNEQLAKMVGIGIDYVIPILIAFLGGKKIYGIRGAAIAGLVSMATIAAVQSAAFAEIVGKSGNAILGAMIFGPLAALVLKHTEKFWMHKIKPGFEMLVNNFYLGILGFVLLFPVYYGAVYGLAYVSKFLGTIVGGMRDYKLYPLIAFIVEPAKILFLNNAINHGVFTPLGAEEVQQTGKSILFLLESNPGPGLGILLAYILIKKDKAIKSQAASSSIVHLFGGIHEVYFPFVLMKPVLIIAAIAGGVFGNAMFQIFDVGAVAAVSPGSIIAQYLQVNKTGMDIAGLTIGIFGSALVSLFTAWIIFSFSSLKNKYFFKKNAANTELSIEVAQNLVKEAKAKSKNQEINDQQKINYSQIVFVCDAGMGSSVMGAGILRNMVKKQGLTNIDISNKAINNLDGTEKVIITIQNLVDVAKQKNPHAHFLVLEKFLDKSRYEEILNKIIKNEK